MIREKLEKDIELTLTPEDIKKLIVEQAAKEGYTVTPDSIKFDINSGTRTTGIGPAESTVHYSDFEGVTFTARENRDQISFRESQKEGTWEESFKNKRIKG